MKIRRALVVACGISCIGSAEFALAQELARATALTTATSTSEAYLNPLHQEEWVTLESDGSFAGEYRQLSNLENIGRKSVSIALMQNGKALSRTASDAEGKFRFEKVMPGTYALVARSDQSMAVYALHVLPKAGSKQLDSSIVVYGSSASPATIDQILRSDLIPENSTIYPIMDRDPLGEARRFNAESKVQLRGTELVGRISRASGLAHYDLTGNSVRVLQDGKAIGQAITNSKGEFSISNVTAGTYDLVVAGKDGMAVGSFQAIAGSGVAVAPGAGNTKLVATATQTDCPSCLNVEVASCNECWATEAPMVEPAPIVENFVDPGMAPIPGGGFVGPGGFPGGGGFAGGGGGFGGGGAGGFGGAGGALGGGRLPLGALLGIGGLAAGVAALAADDEGFNNVPASVIVP